MITILFVRRDKRITGLIHYKWIGGTGFQSIFEMFWTIIYACVSKTNVVSGRMSATIWTGVTSGSRCSNKRLNVTTLTHWRAQSELKSEMLRITLRTMGAKGNFPNGEGLGPEPISPQSSRRDLSNDQPMDQPFKEWHPHRMKTGLRNQPIGKKASMLALPLLRYNAAASQQENIRGASVNDQSRPVASSPTAPN